MARQSFELEQCGLFGEKISHALRTPLGVCLGALEDLLAGYQLDAAGLQDARDAAKAIAQQLDLLKDFSCSRREKSALSLDELITSAGLPFQPGATSSRVQAIPDLLPRALKSLWSYLKTVSSEPARIEISELPGKVFLRFKTTGSKGQKYDDLFDLVRKDSRLESLGVLFAAYVCDEVGGNLSLEADEEMLCFCLELKK